MDRNQIELMVNCGALLYEMGCSDKNWLLFIKILIIVVMMILINDQHLKIIIHS